MLDGVAAHVPSQAGRLDEIITSCLADYASAHMKAGAKGATLRRDLATLRL